MTKIILRNWLLLERVLRNPNWYESASAYCWSWFEFLFVMWAWLMLSTWRDKVAMDSSSRSSWASIFSSSWHSIDGAMSGLFDLVLFISNSISLIELLLMAVTVAVTGCEWLWLSLWLDVTGCDCRCGCGCDCDWMWLTVAVWWEYVTHYYRRNGASVEWSFERFSASEHGRDWPVKVMFIFRLCKFFSIHIYI